MMSMLLSNSMSLNTNTVLLTIAALLPAIVLCVYVFRKDRVEKEPLGLLVALLALGVVICIPAAFFEKMLDPIIYGVFDGVARALPQSALPLVQYSYLFASMTIGVALVEEGLKWIVLNWKTKKNREFNSLFDGLIYAVFVSLGFAAFENVLYVLENGWVNALMRAVLSVPGHMFFAVLMGYYYSLSKITEQAKMIEQELKKRGIISSYATEFSTTKYVALSLIMPILAHGFYNFCCSVGETWAFLSMLCFVLFLYVYCFGKIKALSKADSSIHSYALLMVLRKYPMHAEIIKESLLKY